MISASWGVVQRARDGTMVLATYKRLVNLGFASALKNEITLPLLRNDVVKCC